MDASIELTDTHIKEVKSGIKKYRPVGQVI